MANNTTKNYFRTYEANLILGAQVGATTYIDPSFLNPPKLQDSPLGNRFWDLTSFNIIQDQLFSRINTGMSIIYLGALQTAKYLPNLLIQNYMKEKLYNV